MIKSFEAMDKINNSGDFENLESNSINGQGKRLKR